MKKIFKELLNFSPYIDLRREKKKAYEVFQ